MAGRDWVGLSSTVLEEGIKALVPGSGPVLGLARKALSPELERLSQYAATKSEQKEFADIISAWARRHDVADADLALGLSAARDILRQSGASLDLVASLDLDAHAVAAKVLASDPVPQRDLEGKARAVCRQAVQLFYLRLVEKSQPPPRTAIDKVLLERTGRTEELLEQLSKPSEPPQDLLDRVGADGRPPLVGEADLSCFGCRRARTDIELHGNPYYPYIRRAFDDVLKLALDARTTGADRRMLLLVGDAMAGKSRGGADALRRHPELASRPLLVPSPRGLAQVHQLVPTAGAVVWLDDVDRYFGHLTRADLTRWGAMPNVVVVGTVRRTELDRISSDSGSRGAWDLISDETSVEQVDVPTEWNEADQAALADGPELIRDAVRRGTPLGEVLGAGPELLAKLRNSSPLVRALVAAVVDWQRAGVPDPIGDDKAKALWRQYLSARDASRLGDMSDDEVDAEYQRARTAATAPLPNTYSSMLTLSRSKLSAEAILVDDRNRSGASVPIVVWDEAVRYGLRTVEDAPDVAIAVGYRASEEGEHEIAQRAWLPAAQSGSANAQALLAYLLESADPPDLEGARHWYTRASEAGDDIAQEGLGELLERWDPPDLEGARHWYTLAAEAGFDVAQRRLGELLERWDPPDLEGARRWHTTAAEGGWPLAQETLGELLERWDPPDLEGARHWYTLAAEAGFDVAQRRLGELLERWDPPDLEGARHWYTLAAEAGFEAARASLDELQARIERLDP